MKRDAIVAAVNRKGGSGRTTTTLNLAGALAEQGCRVLLVDLDPQASLTRLLYSGQSVTLRRRWLARHRLSQLTK